MSGRFLFDYLMPAELFLVALTGSGLLIWAAVRARAYLKLISWGFGIAVFMLFASQGTAVLTGLASGETPIGGWEWALTLGMLAVYILMLVVIGVGGVLLVRSLYTKVKPAPPS